MLISVKHAVKLDTFVTSEIPCTRKKDEIDSQVLVESMVSHKQV